MPADKIIGSGYKSPTQMNNLITYVMENPKHQTNGLFGGNMVLIGPASYVYKQMMDVKEYYRKTDGYMMRHIIVSLSKYEMQFIDPKQFYIIGMRICGLFPEYQSVFCINMETDHMHMHLALNTVSFVDGRKLQLGSVYQIRNAIRSIISEYIPLPAALNGLEHREYTTSTFSEEMEIQMVTA